ncbi:MAG: DNA-directed RNA polymerase subunit delta [Bacillaceae bacterium]|nr:DNA-directed RNA polymerase subunit delta [Bacillaceae bacterium]
MSLEKYTQEELAEMSMINIAMEILLEQKQAMDFKEIFDRVAELKGLTPEEKEELIAQFYTDLNIDGRFMTVGSNLWGLKRWYPVDQIEEDITPTVRKKKKKKAKKKVEDEIDIMDDEDLLDDEDDIDDDDFDDDEDYDIDDDDLDDDDLDDEDLDDDLDDDVIGDDDDLDFDDEDDDI